MTVTGATSRWSHAAAHAEAQAMRARLRADLAAGADVQLIAADKTAILGLHRRIAHSAGTIDVLV